MFQVSILFFLIASASATYYGDEFINYIDHEYEDAPRVVLPYAYQNHRINAVVEEEPFYAANFEPVVLPGLRAKDVSVSTIEHTSVGLSSFGIMSLVFKAVTLIKTLLVMIVKNGSALVIGGLAVIGIYQLASICFSASTFHNLANVQSQIMSYASPDTISRATEFVVEAVRKYRSLQNS